MAYRKRSASKNDQKRSFVRVLRGRRYTSVETGIGCNVPNRWVGGARGVVGVKKTDRSRFITSSHRVGREYCSRIEPSFEPRCDRRKTPVNSTPRSRRTHPKRVGSTTCATETPKKTTLMSNSRANRATSIRASKRSVDVTWPRARCCVNPIGLWPNGPVGQSTLRSGRSTVIREGNEGMESYSSNSSQPVTINSLIVRLDGNVCKV